MANNNFLKMGLQQKLLQKLSPQQIQMIKLLEVPAMQLEQRIKKELEENPVLEEGADGQEDQLEDYDVNENDNDTTENNDDEFSLEDYVEDDEIPNYKLNTQNHSKDDKREEIPFSVGITFHDFLENQLGLRPLSERQFRLGQYIIGNIDEDGYLRRNLEAIVDDMAFNENIETTEEELEEVLAAIQSLEPAGIGARNLQECLLLQLKEKDNTQQEIKLAIQLIEDHFEAFTKKHYEKIIQHMDISNETLKNIIDLIVKLNPKPGSSFSDDQNKNYEYIIPDFILENNNGELQLNLNSKNVPELHVSNTYTNMIKEFSQNKNAAPDKKKKEALAYMRQKLDAAKWFIDAIRQRQNTMLLVMNAIIKYQYEYFLEGDEMKFKPMILKDIATETDLDISTISRVASSKYIQTHFGIFPLKYFFSEGIQNEKGEEVSTREVKKILQDCINNESKKKPLTDEKLVEILKERGYSIARRTIAKYREQLKIPVARLRKSLEED
jgi:RNA polymerase sigma-54 factor